FRGTHRAVARLGKPERRAAWTPVVAKMTILDHRAPGLALILPAPHHVCYTSTNENKGREVAMIREHDVSRRRILAMSGAAASFGTVGHRDAAAQAGRRIERLDPALDRIIDASEPIVDIATNLGGTANVEGPLWWKEGGYLLFRGTDQRRWKYTPGQPIAPV